MPRRVLLTAVNADQWAVIAPALPINPITGKASRGGHRANAHALAEHRRGSMRMRLRFRNDRGHVRRTPTALYQSARPVDSAATARVAFSAATAGVAFIEVRRGR